MRESSALKMKLVKTRKFKWPSSLTPRAVSSLVGGSGSLGKTP